MDKLVCSYCDKERKEVKFFIGASLEQDIEWTVWEGTGKISCTDRICWRKAKEESMKAVKKL